MELEDQTNIELKRMNEIMPNVKVNDREDLFNFANDYYNDGKHFIEKGDLVSGFEALVIAWSYIDMGLKLGFFEIPEELKKHFTIE